MNSNSTRRFVAIAATSVLVFGMAATACGEDVINDDVEKQINDIDDSIEEFVDTIMTTDETSPTTTGG